MNNGAGVLPVQTTKGKPPSCTQCSSVLESAYDNMVLRLGFFHHLWRLNIVVLLINHWIYLVLLLRLTRATSARTCSTTPVYHRSPPPVTTTTCFCSILRKSRSQKKLCCSSASTSLVPWAWPSRWEPTNWWRAVCHQRRPAFTFIYCHFSKVTEKQGVVHRSRLNVSVSSFPIHN